MDGKISTKSAFVWQYISIGAQGILQLIATMVFSRILSAEDFGVMSIAMVFVNFSAILSQLGLGASLIQKKEIDQEHLEVCFTFSFLFGAIFTLILFFLSTYIGQFYQSNSLGEILKVVCFMFLISSAYTVQESIMVKKLMFKKLGVINVISYLFGYVGIGFFMAYNDCGIWSIVYANIGVHIIKLGLYLFEVKFLKFNFSLKHLKDLLSFGAGFSLARLFNFGATNFDTLLVGKLMGEFVVGIYSRAYAVMMLPIQYFASSLEKILFPIMSKIQNDKPALKKYFLELNAVICNVMLPFSILMVLNSDLVIDVLLGSKWTKAIIPLQYLSASIFFRNAYKVGDSLAKSTGFVILRSKREFVYAVLIVLSILLTYQFGINVVSAAIMVVIILNFVMTYATSQKILGFTIKEFLMCFTQGFYLSLLLGIVSLCLRYITDVINLTIFIKVFLHLVIYGGIILFIFFKRNTIFIHERLLILMNKTTKK